MKIFVTLLMVAVVAAGPHMLEEIYAKGSPADYIACGVMGVVYGVVCLGTWILAAAGADK